LIGAVGTFFATRAATMRQLRGMAALSRRDRREEACLDLLSLLAPVRAMVTTILPNARPAEGKLFQTRVWFAATRVINPLMVNWNEHLRARIGTRESRDLFEALAQQYAEAQRHMQLPENPPAEGFWSTIDGLADA